MLYRKHMSSVPTTKTGFSKLTISGSAIVSDKSSTLKRQGSFTILDPASGIPSDGTPRLQASLTSRHSALMLPGGTNLLQMSMSSAANLHNQASFLMNTSQSLNTNTKESPLPLTAVSFRRNYFMRSPFFSYNALKNLNFMVSEVMKF